MKKGILLILILTSFIIVSCAVDEHPFVTSDNRIDITEELKNLSRVEAYQKTADDLYMGYLSATGFNNLLAILTAIEKGTLQGNPIGDITSPYVAAVILQKLYTTMKYDNLPNNLDEPTKLALSAITDPAKLETDYAGIRSALVNFTPKRYEELALQFKAFVDHQDIIGKIVEDYANRLLTTSSSASKPSGSDDTVTVDNFQVVVNAASTIAAGFNKGIVGKITDNATVTSLISDSLYNLSDASKLQITYNQSLRYFLTDHYPKIADNVSMALFSTVLTEFINNDGKTTGPQMGDTESGDIAEPVTDPYGIDDTSEYKGGTSSTIYNVIAKRLYGAPLDPTRNYTDADNKGSFLDNNTTSYVSRDNALTFYQTLRTFGMKIPYKTVTSIPGHKTIADIISKHLRMNGFSYKDFNVNTTTDRETFQKVMDTMFKPKTTGSNDYPVCALILEVNTAIDESAAGHFENDGDYNATFLGLTAGSVGGQTANTTALTNPCKITLTKIQETVSGTTTTYKLIEYPFNDTASTNQDSNGNKYTTQTDSTGL